LTITLGGWYLSSINDARQREIASRNQHDAVIREYIKEMKGMLVDKSIAKDAKQPGSEVHGVARALTLTAINQLQNASQDQKSMIFEFLREASFPVLASSDWKRKAKLNRFGSDITDEWKDRANLQFSKLCCGVVLSGSNLTGANLRGADLRGSWIRGADLSGTKLRMAYLNEARLEQSKLVQADLRGANFIGANFSGGYSDKAYYPVEAKLREANLSGATFKDTICPNGKKTDTGC
jgi:uncharacterized protein YjbI with pentapeptide repeats